MSNIPIKSVLGANVTQDANTITVQKNDLNQNSGLSVLAENDGESVLAAIILQAIELGLDVAHRDGDGGDLSGNFNQQVAINPVATSFLTRDDSQGNSVWFKRDSYTIDFDLPLTQLNPNDY